MATVPAPPAFQRFLGGLVDLFKAGHGAASFEVDADGGFVPAGTVITVKMETGEGIEAFHQRLRRDYGLEQGDRIEILANGGRCDTARLTLRPRP